MELATEESISAVSMEEGDSRVMEGAVFSAVSEGEEPAVGSGVSKDRENAVESSEVGELTSGSAVGEDDMVGAALGPMAAMGSSGVVMAVTSCISVAPGRC